MDVREIKIKIHEEEDLYSEYDPEQNLLSEDVVSYLEHNYVNKHRKKQEEYIIHIYSDAPVDEERVKSRFRDYLLKEKDNVSYDIKKMTIKQIALLIVGLIIITIWAFLEFGPVDSNDILVEILCIFSWVPIWEVANIALMERPEKMILKNAYKRIMNAEIVFHVVQEQENA